MVREIRAGELAAQQAAGEPLFLLDVREGWEVALAAISGSVHIPMNLIPIRLSELPDDRPIITICHHGVRSYQVAHFLQENGFDNVQSLAGGVEAWACEVDPKMARY